jgi:hypothetical protein
MVKKSIFLILVILASGLGASELNAQCPMCKTALKSSQTGARKVMVGNGINRGILFLMSMPYIMVGAAGFAWYRYQKNRQNA